MPETEERVNVDLHNHLGRNGGKLEPNKVVDIAYGRLGPGGVFGVVNSNPDDYRYERFVDSIEYEKHEIGDLRNGVYIPSKNITIIRMQELTKGEGHLLIGGLKRGFNLKERKSLLDSLKEAEDNNTAKILVHPFSKKGAGRYLEKLHNDYQWNLDSFRFGDCAREGVSLILGKGEHDPILDYLKHLDAIEVLNSQASWNANADALIFYRMLKKEFSDLDIGMCSFSDSHSGFHVAKSSTPIPRLDITSSETLVSSMRSGIRGVKHFGDLHFESLRIAAFKHAVNMITGKGIFLRE